MAQLKRNKGWPHSGQGSGDLWDSAQAPRPIDPAIPRLRSADPADWPVHPAWQPLLRDFWAEPCGQGLLRSLQARLAAGKIVYPCQPLRALATLAPSDVRVLILGQDPYHGPGQAEGLAFSVAQGVALPPSLRNIFKEIQRDLGHPMPGHGSLLAWAQSGILLLNTCLTVEDGQAASHADLGWQQLTDRIVTEVARRSTVCVHLLWGGQAQAKAGLIEQTSRQHGNAAMVLQANHPSPLSALRPPRPFIGCAHFSQATAWLHEQGLAWRWPGPA